MINHKVTKLVVAFAVGIFLSLYSYRIITDPEPAIERAREEAAVLQARDIIHRAVLPDGELEVVDPLATNRVVGKTYIYPVEGGWQISGHYRRDTTDHWHPFLMSLDQDLRMQALSVKDADPRLLELSEADPRFTVTP